MELKWVNKYAIFIIIILCFLSRLPLLLSENLCLDGDECIMGLMAKHYSEGIDIPYFFYGQSYGFSFIEVVAIRIFYWLFGINDISVKLAMLSLWTVGVIFLYKTLKQIESKNNIWLPLLITLTFIFVPSFAIWSMKARGGYLTAFLGTYIITYLISNKHLNRFLITPFIIGLLSIIVYQSQALWLAGLFPILAYYILTQEHFRYNISLFSGVITATLIFNILKIGLSTFWSPQVITRPNFNLDGIISVLVSIYRNQTGSYFYNSFTDPIFITKIIAIFITLLIFGALITGLIFFIKKKEIHPLFYVTSFSVLITINYIFFIDASNARYILPLNSYIFIMFYLFSYNLDGKKIINTFLGLIILLGTYSIYDFKNFSPENKSDLLNIIDKLETENIHHVYCEAGLLQWQLMFYSKEHIIARSKSNIDRYPEYVKLVNNAFKGTEAITAMVGYSYESNSLQIYENPNRKFLEEHGFKLDEVENDR